MFWIVPKIQERGEANSSGSGVLNSGLTTSIYVTTYSASLCYGLLGWKMQMIIRQVGLWRNAWEIKHLITVDIVK